MLVIYNKDIKNLSEIKKYSFDKRYVGDKDGNVYLLKEKEKVISKVIKIKPYINRDGYVEYVLSYPNGLKKHILAHRVTAGLFLKEVHSKNYVNHKDGNKKNNSLSNLEYMSQSENIKHTYDVLKRKPSNT